RPAVLLSQVAHDGVALPEPEIAVVDHRHHAHRIDLAERRFIGRPEAPTPVLALVREVQLPQHPQNLAHVDGVGPSVDLEHGLSLPAGTWDEASRAPSPLPSGSVVRDVPLYPRPPPLLVNDPGRIASPRLGRKGV